MQTVPLLNAESNPAAEELMGVVNVSGRTVSVTGYDPLAPPKANQRDADFDIRLIDGPRALIKIGYKRIVDTWVQGRGNLLRPLAPLLAKRLHRRMSELMKVEREAGRGGKNDPGAALRCLHAAWRELFHEDAPTAAAKFEHRARIENHRAWFKRSGLPFDDRWSLEQMAEFRQHPELIATMQAGDAMRDEAARLEAEEAAADVASHYVPPPTSGQRSAPPPSAAAEFLGMDAPAPAAPASPVVTPGIDEISYPDDDDELGQG